MPPRAVVLLLLLATGLGIGGDTLLRVEGVGLNAAIMTAALTVTAGLVTKRLGRSTSDDARWLWLAVPCFGACLAWRDSEILRALDVLALLTGLALLALRSQGVGLVTASFVQYLRGFVSTGEYTLIGAAPLAFVDLPRAELPWRRYTVPARAAVIGLGLAAVPVLVFGGLFASADPVFESVVAGLFDWNVAKLLPHVATTGVLAWLSAGYLRHHAVADTRLDRATTPSPPRLGIVEVGIPLGATIAVFAVFLAIQARYLFGGVEVAMQSAGLSFAEYARRGFFELVTASALVIPLLLVAGWAFGPPSNPRHRAVFRALVVVQLVLVGALMLSALHRMLLYVDAYGLSQIRVYATAFMLWIAGTLAWMAAATLRGRSQRFMYAAAVRGFVLVALLNVVNVDAAIARTNLARAAAGRPLDTAYLSELSADAAPTIAAALPDLEPAMACPLAHHLRWTAERSPTDWRAWNLSRRRAGRAVSGAAVDALDCA